MHVVFRAQFTRLHACLRAACGYETTGRNWLLLLSKFPFLHLLDAIAFFVLVQVAHRSVQSTDSNQ